MRDSKSKLPYTSYESVKRALEAKLSVLNDKYRQNCELVEEFKAKCNRRNFLRANYGKNCNRAKSNGHYTQIERAHILHQLEAELDDAEQEFKSVRRRLKENNRELKKVKAEHDKIMELFNVMSNERFNGNQMQ